MDFGMLPPEINSTRIYSGPGSGPMTAAANTWELLASDLHASAAAYRSVISELTVTSWQGPSSILMADSAAPYVAWLHSTATQAEQAASQARTAAGAYRTAYAMTVPPALIDANRIQLASLIESNYLGQNSPAIAATEAAYEQMWAQDAAAMYGYAGSSAAATRLTPFSDPPQTTNSSRLIAQTASASTAHTPTASQLPTTLQQLAAPAAPADPSSGLTATDVFNDSVSSASGAASVTSASFSGDSISTTNHAIAINASRDAAQGIGPFLAGSTSSSQPGMPANLGTQATSAVMGRASLVRALSVPQTWAATATPAVDPAALALPSPNPSSAVTAPGGMAPGTFGEALLGTLAGRSVSNVAAKLRTPRVVPRSPAAG